MNDKIEKEFLTFSYDKYGKFTEVSDPIPINVEVEIKTELSPMCKDLLELLKDKDVFSFSLVCVVENYGSPKIDTIYFDLEFLDKIVFDEYFLEIGRFKIFYNGIFGFSKAKRW